jgi:hypothetical protein
MDMENLIANTVYVTAVTGKYFVIPDQERINFTCVVVH